MKKLMLMMAVLALVAIAGYSEDAKETKEPSELTAAKKAYAEQIDRVTAPVRSKQVALLQKLQKQLAAKGDLAGATMVQTELNRVVVPSVGLFIRKATYGFDSSEVDVTRKVREKVKNNVLDVVVDNSLTDGDPSPGHHKILTIEYVLDGNSYTMKVVEEQRCVLGR